MFSVRVVAWGCWRTFNWSSINHAREISRIISEGRRRGRTNNTISRGSRFRGRNKDGGRRCRPWLIPSTNKVVGLSEFNEMGGIVGRKMRKRGRGWGRRIRGGHGGRERGSCVLMKEENLDSNWYHVENGSYWLCMCIQMFVYEDYKRAWETSQASVEYARFTIANWSDELDQSRRFWFDVGW